jgi:hypothetical protein
MDFFTFSILYLFFYRIERMMSKHICLCSNCVRILKPSCMLSCDILWLISISFMIFIASWQVWSNSAKWPKHRGSNALYPFFKHGTLPVHPSVTTGESRLVSSVCCLPFYSMIVQMWIEAGWWNISYDILDLLIFHIADQSRSTFSSLCSFQFENIFIDEQ